MKKVILSVAVVAAFFTANNAKAQLVDEQNVTVTMDLQPILQLGMNGSSNVDFVFDQISEYVGGITQYGATSLNVSSTVNWDLYAAGFSSKAAATPTLTVWDQQVVYGTGTDPNAIDDLPLSLLELRQDKVNPSAAGATEFKDYAAAFSSSTLTPGSNNVYATGTPYTKPGVGEKYIAGHNLTTDFVVGGTYLVSNGTNVGAASNYYYTIDYRIVPGLPAVFPRASLNDGTTSQALTGGDYAQPGVYTMNVKYVLMEN